MLQHEVAVQAGCVRTGSFPPDPDIACCMPIQSMLHLHVHTQHAVTYMARRRITTIQGISHIRVFKETPAPNPNFENPQSASARATLTTQAAAADHCPHPPHLRELRRSSPALHGCTPWAARRLILGKGVLWLSSLAKQRADTTGRTWCQNRKPAVPLKAAVCAGARQEQQMHTSNHNPSQP